MNDLDELWAGLLSGDPHHIQPIWDGLGEDERQAVRDHLTRMRDEDGWHSTQREAAGAALQVIRDLTH
jgi:hypothetical protein